MRCLVTGKPCRQNDIFFKKCGCHARTEHVSKWLALDWEDQDNLPCPRCDTQARLKEVPSKPTIVYLDSTCSHCNKLEEAIGNRSVWECGFVCKHVGPDNARVNSPFPHTFKIDKDTHVQVQVPDEIVNMFSRMAGIEPDAEVNINIFEPKKKAQHYHSHVSKHHHPEPSAPPPPYTE